MVGRLCLHFRIMSSLFTFYNQCQQLMTRGLGKGKTGGSNIHNIQSTWQITFKQWPNFKKINHLGKLQRSSSLRN